MAQLTLRNVSEDLVRALRVRALHHGRSAEDEHRSILELALASETNDFWGRADSFRIKTRKQHVDSADLQRELRDQR